MTFAGIQVVVGDGGATPVPALGAWATILATTLLATIMAWQLRLQRRRRPMCVTQLR